jgi:hypothetical protein
MLSRFIYRLLSYGLLLTLSTTSLSLVFAQQVPDDKFDPKIITPSYQTGKGPVILLDEGHHNFHTISGRYSTFTRILRLDGYVVKPHKGRFTPESIKHADILVVANALHEDNVTIWAQPILSAFTGEEIKLLKKWVEAGGSLFLIADHMPFPGAASDLAKAFGFGFLDGFARDTVRMAKKIPAPDIFTREEGTLSDHYSAQGKLPERHIDTVGTFGGQAFSIPQGAVSLITLPDRFDIILPDTARVVTPQTPRFQVGGYSQGAVAQIGKGRIAVFGEAAMFSAQISAAKTLMGLNHPNASGNVNLLRNLVAWLTEDE